MSGLILDRMHQHCLYINIFLVEIRDRTLNLLNPFSFKQLLIKNCSNKDRYLWNLYWLGVKITEKREANRKQLTTHRSTTVTRVFWKLKTVRWLLAGSLRLLAFDNKRYSKDNPAWKRHAGKLGPETRKIWLGLRINWKSWGRSSFEINIAFRFSICCSWKKLISGMETLVERCTPYRWQPY